MRKLLAFALLLVLGACGGVDDADCAEADCPCEGEDCLPTPNEPEPEDPEEDCRLVPMEGTCSGVFTALRCETAEGKLRVVEERCDGGTYCVKAWGSTSCMPYPDSCPDGVGFCTPEGTARRCEGGSWSDTPCEQGCSETSSGPVCREKRPGLVLHRAKVTYDHHVPSRDRSGWAVEVRPRGSKLRPQPRLRRHRSVRRHRESLSHLPVTATGS